MILRMLRTVALPTGITQLPTRMVRAGPPTWELDSSGW